MKKIGSLTTVIAMCIVVFISSCAKEEDGPVPPGGSFPGNWEINENSSLYGPKTYNLTIADTASNISFSQLYGFHQKVFALVSGNSFSIPNQLISGTTFTGKGFLTSPTRIDMTYYVANGISTDTIVAILNKY